MRTRLSFPLCAVAVALAFSLSNLCLAQPGTTTSRATITHVKSEMLNEWLDLQKNEVVPALKKAGVKTRTVYVSNVFGNAGEYLAVQPFEKYAEFDGDNPVVKALGAAGAARLGEKLRKCILNQNSFVTARLDDISNVIGGSPLPAAGVFVRYRIAPGRMQDFQNLVKSDVLPVYKKANVGLTVAQRLAGANGDVVMTTAISKYADMDGGNFLVKQLGQDGANKVNAKFTGIRTLIEAVVRTRVADLSF